ncbi:MAG: hypothetical protein QM699_12185 [Amaricoccus sp.]|uniref:calcium-binding protein n=1 Tax=Amaricoccus sp. TaxID=1872485 RepID=UPI0039E32394
MTLTITLTAQNGQGVNFNTGYDAFFNDFTPYGFPLMNGPTSTRITQFVHLDTPVTGQEAQTKAILVNGDNFQYTFANHTVSGEVDEVRLVRLGAAYNAGTGDLNLTNGTVQTAADYITIAGLDLQNAPGVKGDVHELIAGFMGGGPSGTEADPTALSDHLWSEGHNVIGSTGSDSYVGSRFADIARGYGGNDTLSGQQGNDRLEGGVGKDVLLGGIGNDTLVGGGGADRMTGGTGADTFVFNAVTEPATDLVTDFSRTQKDKIQLSAIDADTSTAGNQAFHWIAKAAFSGDAGELRYVTSGGKTIVYGDDDGNKVADFHIDLTGTIALAASDFIL